MTEPNTVGSDGQLARDFKLFLDRAEQVWVLAHTHERLFEGGPDQDETLRNSAGFFFKDLDGWMRDLFFIYADRLFHDPEGNLTAGALIRELERKGTVSEDIKALEAQLSQYRKYNLRQARNKLVAHSDTVTLRMASILGKHSKNELDAFLVDLQKFCYALGKALNEPTPAFLSCGGNGGVDDLLAALARAMKVREDCGND